MPTPASGNIASIAYDEDTLDLDVAFNSGETYRYSSVPAAVWRGFQRAESKGGYLHRTIKPRFAYEKL